MASASVKANLTVVLDSSDANFNPASVTALSLTATRPFVVVDAYVIARATVGGATATLSKGAAANAIFAALACATDGTVTRAATAYNVTNATIAVGDALTISSSADATRGTVYATIIPSAIS